MAFTPSTKRLALLTSSTIVMALDIGTTAAHAQVTSSAAVQPTDTDPQSPSSKDIIVTGSRIRRSSDTTSPAPVAVIGSESLAEKGYVQVGDVLNELPSNTPTRTGQGPALSNGQAVAGQDYPNLFSLGPARTLTLVNGRRMPPTTSGLGDEATDVNIIPTGLLDRVEVVQGGGAAVYGSGAIAGVVKYILKNKYQGIDLQVQNRLPCLFGSSGRRHQFRRWAGQYRRRG